MQLFRSIFDVPGWHAACVASAAGLRDSAKSFRSLLDHISEGLRFYIGMADVVGKARQECNDFAFTRQVSSEEGERQWLYVFKKTKTLNTGEGFSGDVCTVSIFSDDESLQVHKEGRCCSCGMFDTDSRFQAGFCSGI